MSETPETTQPTPQQPQGEQPKPTPPSPPTTVPAREETDWKAEALKWEKRSKENFEALKPLKEQMDGLRAVFGDKAADPGQDIVKTLTEKVSAIERKSLVNEVARRHGITADEDIELLRNQPDEQGMARLAERLKVAATTAPASPAPDPSQGSAPLTPEAAATAEYERFFPSKT